MAAPSCPVFAFWHDQSRVCSAVERASYQLCPRLRSYHIFNRSATVAPLYSTLQCNLLPLRSAKRETDQSEARRFVKVVVPVGVHPRALAGD